MNVRGGAAATLYSAETGATTVGNPRTTDTAGRIEAWVDSGSYDLVVSKSGYTSYTLPYDASIGKHVKVLSEAPLNIDYPEYAGDLAAGLAAVPSTGGAVRMPGRATSRALAAVHTIKAKTHLFGDGPGATVLAVGGPAHTAGSINGLTTVSGADKLVLENFSVVGPEDGTMLTAPNNQGTGFGFLFDTVTDFVVRNVRVSRFNTQGMYFGACSDGLVEGCWAKEMYSGNGFSLDGLCVDIKLIGNTARDIADCGFGTHNGAVGTIIEGNNVRNTSFGRGVDVMGAPDTLVAHNVLREIGGNGGAGHGIYVYPGLAGTLPSRVRVIGNEVHTPDDYGIVIDGSSAWADAMVALNQVFGATGVGIYATGLVSRLQLLSNAVKGTTGPGIFLDSTGGAPSRVWVDGNQSTENSTVGMRCAAGVTDVRYGKNDWSGNTAAATDIPLPTVVAAGALTLPAHSGVVQVTGNTNITSITAGPLGERVVLIFTGTPTLTDGSNLKLGANFVATADDAIELICDGTNWYAIGPGSAN